MHTSGSICPLLSLKQDEFPFVLVPLSNDNQDAQLAAKECIEWLYTLCSRVVVFFFLAEKV